MKRAFTLIELLVVIAIIAILAAILFPVFAQAKLSAKRTASLNNCKQTQLASLMYAGDYDDTFVLMTGWGPVGQNDGALVYFTHPGGARGCHPWPELINPYMKNFQIFEDPQAPPPPSNVYNGVTFAPQVRQLFGPMYGMNPYMTQTVTFPYGAGGGPFSTRSMTTVSRPADTVNFTQKYSLSEQISPYNVFYGMWWFQYAYFVCMAADPPDCYAPGNVYYCAAGWNNNGYYGGSGGLKLLNNVEAAGAWTGGGSMRGNKLMLVSFVDGHSKVMAPGTLAEGTAYNGAKAANGIPIQTENQIVITDINREHYYGLQ